MYVMDTMARVEQKVEANERAIYEYSKELESVNSTLDMIKQKQEMVLISCSQHSLERCLYRRHYLHLRLHHLLLLLHAHNFQL